jgi:hypothetical protein
VLEREWVSVRDPADPSVLYTFDVSFLLSRYRCIYGAGCQGVCADGPDEVVGCCVHGAYYVDPEDRARTEALVADLDPATMDHHAEAVGSGVTELDEDGEPYTRIVDGACIFLNRGTGQAAPGCALHQLAERRGEHPMTHKPVVCWQLPLHRSIAEETANDGSTQEVHTIAPFERGTWGEGGADFHWWCTEDPSAFTARRPVYRTMERELRAMVGDAVYDELARFLARRALQRTRVRYLPLAR